MTMTELTDQGFPDTPSFVWAVTAPDGLGRLRAVCFARKTTPNGDGQLYHRIEICAHRRAALAKFAELPPLSLETRDKLEQLRAFEAGIRVDVSIIDSALTDVNTPEDLEHAWTAYQGS